MRVFRWFVREGPIGLAFVLLAVGALLSGVYQVVDETNEGRHDRDQEHQIDRLAFEQECRFELSLPVSEAQAEKLDALALGLVAAAEDDDDGLAAQVERVRRASVAEREALEARAAAVETCNERADRLFG